jgi:hypothetical protein
MSVDRSALQIRHRTIWGGGVLALATAIACLSAHRFAGSWNDGSRLATVESLVDYHMWAIDDSIFVQVPAERSPYPANDPGLQQHGTGDKLLIDGHFYSDKSPVPALLLAGCYQILQTLTGLTARADPAGFCYWMTLVNSGLAYVLAVWCVFQMAGTLGLVLSVRLALTASFGLSTVALTYVRHVNNHILLLGITAALLLGLVRLSQGCRGGGSLWQLLGLGTLAGLGYTVDLGAGPVILLCTLGFVAFRCPRRIAVFLLGALPWLVLHHAVNYSIGGSWKPANAVPEYFQWPGSSFSSQNLTGSWNHPGVGHFLIYAAALLVGKRGFLGHNLPLFLALPALVVLLYRSRPGSCSATRLATINRAEVLFAGCCCGGIWLLYALTSNNYSGLCCSIRWFVPMLAPAYLALALHLREEPRFAWVFLVLSGWGAVLAAIMWSVGPWTRHMVPFFWPVQGAAFLSLVGIWIWRRRSTQVIAVGGIDQLLDQGRAA